MPHNSGTYYLMNLKTSAKTEGENAKVDGLEDANKLLVTDKKLKRPARQI